MVYDKIGIGRAIYTNGVDIDKTSTFTARAYEDSVDGYVEISVDGSGIISVPTTVSVSQGDTVMVTKVNNQSTVTGVVGGGDAMVDDIDAAAAAAALAAAKGIAAAQAAADAQAEIDGVKEYFYNDFKGAHVTSTPKSPTDHMVTVDSNGMHLLEENVVVAEFKADEANLLGESLKLKADATASAFNTITSNGSLRIVAYPQSAGLAQNLTLETYDEASTIVKGHLTANGVVRQMFVAEENAGTLSDNEFDNVSISISSHNCVQRPVCIPQSDGWLITQAPNSISTSSISGQVANFSGASHAGVARYLCIEYYGMSAPN